MLYRMRYVAKCIGYSIFIAVLCTPLFSSAASDEAQAPGSVSIRDAGFEQKDAAWCVPAKFTSYVRFSENPVHGGRNSLEIKCENPAVRPWCFQSIDSIQESVTVRWSGLVCGTPMTIGAQAEMRIEALDIQGVRCGLFNERLPLLGDADWKQLSVEAELPVNTVKIHAALRLIGAGTAYFDDVSFDIVSPPKPFVLLGQSHVNKEREKIDFDIPVRLYAGLNHNDKLECEIRIVDKADRLIDTLHCTAPRTRDTQFNVRRKSLDSGIYHLEFRIPELSPDLTYTKNLYVMPKREKPEGLNKDGILLDAEKKEFFPIGIYHVTTQDYPLVKQQGFNAVQGITDRNLDSFGRSLDAAQEYGLKVDVPLYTGLQVKENLPVSIEKLNRFGDHPAVLSWKIYDEPDRRPELEPEVFDTYQQLSSLKPKRPLLLTVYDPKEYAFWANACDALQADPYPLPDRPLGLVSEWFLKARNSTESWQHAGVVLQAGWLADLSNQPTPQQAQTMVVLSLIEGAESVFWYSLRDPDWDLTKTPLWAAFPTLNKTTQDVAQIIREGDQIRDVEVDAEGIAWLARQHTITATNGTKQNPIFVILANPLRENRVATIKMRKGWNADIAPNQMDVSILDDNTFRLMVTAETSRIIYFLPNEK